MSSNNAPIEVKPLEGGGGGGRPGIGEGFDSGHRPIVGTFDRFNGLSSNILLTFSYYFDNPQMPWATLQSMASACTRYIEIIKRKRGEKWLCTREISSSSTILCKLGPGVGHLNRNSQLDSNAPPMPGFLPPPSPSSYRDRIDRCIIITTLLQSTALEFKDSNFNFIV